MDSASTGPSQGTRKRQHQLTAGLPSSKHSRTTGMQTGRKTAGAANRHVRRCWERHCGWRNSEIFF